MKVHAMLSMPALAGALLGLAGLGQRPADGSVVFRYVADTPANTKAASGTQVPVNVYLQEILSGGSPSVLAANDGVAGVGVAMARTSGAGAAITGATPDTTDFAGPSGQTVTDAAASFVENLDPNATHGIKSGNGPAPVQPLSDVVYLGQFMVTVNSTAAPTTFTVGPKGTTGGNTLDNSGDDLDISGTAGNNEAYTGAADPSVTPFSFTVNAVPEPASLGVLGLGGLALLARRRRMA